MILLMSEYNDNSTIYVAQWFLHWNIPFVRIDCEEIYVLKKVCISNNGYRFLIRNKKGKIIDMNEVKAVWYRRGELNLVFPDLSFLQNQRLLEEVRAHLEVEKLTIENFFYNLMQEKPHIGTFSTRSVNKLQVLHEASFSGKY